MAISLEQLAVYQVSLDLARAISNGSMTVVQAEKARPQLERAKIEELQRCR